MVSKECEGEAMFNYEGDEKNTEKLNFLRMFRYG